MMCRVLGQQLRHLLRTCHPYVSDHAAMKSFWEIKVQDTFGEIRTIPESDMKMRFVGR